MNVVQALKKELERLYDVEYITVSDDNVLDYGLGFKHEPTIDPDRFRQVLINCARQTFYQDGDRDSLKKPRVKIRSITYRIKSGTEILCIRGYRV